MPSKKPSYDDYVITAPGGPYSFHDTQQTNTITCLAGGTEMLKVGPDGFWVRGVKVEQGPNEAEEVYRAFKQWMEWQVLTRDYQ